MITIGGSVSPLVDGYYERNRHGGRTLKAMDIEENAGKADGKEGIGSKEIEMIVINYLLKSQYNYRLVLLLTISNLLSSPIITHNTSR